MSRMFGIVLILATVAFGAKYHYDVRGSENHTPLRWTVADSAARVGLTVYAIDTMKMALQLSDTTFWLLTAYSPATWRFMGGKTVDSLYVKKALRSILVSGDSVYSASAVKGPRVRGDSAVLPILTGNVVTRGTMSVDSLFSTRGISGVKGVFSSTVTVDSLASAKGISATIVRGDSAVLPILTGNVTTRGALSAYNLTSTLALNTVYVNCDSASLPIVTSNLESRGTITGTSLSTNGSDFVKVAIIKVLMPDATFTNSTKVGITCQKIVSVSGVTHFGRYLPEDTVGSGGGASHNYRLYIASSGDTTEVFVTARPSTLFNTPTQDTCLATIIYTP